MSRPFKDSIYITVTDFCKMQGIVYVTYRKYKALGLYRNVEIIERAGINPRILRADAEAFCQRRKVS